MQWHIFGCACLKHEWLKVWPFAHLMVFCALHNLQCSLYTPHIILCTTQCTLSHSPHSMLFCAPSAEHVTHSTPWTVHTDSWPLTSSSAISPASWLPHPDSPHRSRSSLHLASWFPHPDSLHKSRSSPPLASWLLHPDSLHKSTSYPQVAIVNLEEAASVQILVSFGFLDASVISCNAKLQQSVSNGDSSTVDTGH